MRAVIFAFAVSLLSFLCCPYPAISRCGPITSWNTVDARLFFESGEIALVNLSNEISESRPFTLFSINAVSPGYRFSIQSYSKEAESRAKYERLPCESTLTEYVMVQEDDLCISCRANPYPPDEFDPAVTGSSYNFTMRGVYGANLITLAVNFPGGLHPLSSFQSFALEVLDKAKKLIDRKCGSYVIDPPSSSLPVGETKRFSVFRVVGQERIPVLSENLSWLVAQSISISPYILNADIGEINNSGEFTGRNIGWCIVRAKIDDSTWVDASVRVDCRAALSGDLEKIKTLYRDSIPEGPIHEDLREGNISFPYSKMVPGYATNLFSLRYGKYGDYVCGAYQNKVLRFLHAIEADPERCILLNGYEFGPVEASLGGHHAVVIYSRGTDWKETGLILDPWYNQRPEYYSVDIWKKVFSFVRGSTLPAYQNQYPTTATGGTPTPDTGFSSQFTGASGFAGVADCPVDILITDRENRRLGVLDDGTPVFEIPEGYFLRIPDGEGGYRWYFRLGGTRTDEYTLTITGREEGSFDLFLARPEDQAVRYYEEQPVSPGEAAVTTIDSDELSSVLTLANGEQRSPTIHALPGGCLSLDEDLSIFVACAQYAGVKFMFSFDYVEGLKWTVDTKSLASVDYVECLEFGTDLSLSIPCVEFGGSEYGFTIRHAGDLEWELVVDSLTVARKN